MAFFDHEGYQFLFLNLLFIYDTRDLLYLNIFSKIRKGSILTLKSLLSVEMFSFKLILRSVRRVDSYI